MGFTMFWPSIFGSIFWHFWWHFTHFWSKSEVMDLILNGFSSENVFFKNVSFLIKIDDFSSKKRSKIVIFTNFSVFPGGIPGNRENRKIWSALVVRFCQKLPEVYGFWRFFPIFIIFRHFHRFYVFLTHF